MTSVAERARGAAQRAQNTAMDSYWDLRQRSPAVDHLVRAYERYSDRNGTQLAGAVTYFAFLSFFPILALAFAVVGYLTAVDVQLQHYLEEALDEALPGLSDQLPVEQIAHARVGAGLIGGLGLLYAGLNSVSAAREALHAIWLNSLRQGPNFFVRKGADLLVMVGLGTALLLTVALTSVGQSATYWMLSLVGLDGSVVAGLALRLLALLVATAMNVLVFVLAFSLLSGAGRPTRPMWWGALIGAVGFEALKSAATLILAGTLTNPVYASFAVLVGLLVWINLVMRLVLFSAAWTATWLPVMPPYTGSLPLPEENGLDWTRRRKVLRPSPEALAERRLAQRILAALVATVAAAVTAGAAAVLMRRGGGDRD